MNILSSLRYLVALNEHRHFGRAAQACHITQPALSNAIRALEDEFKVAIVRRDRAFVGLTPEGERVLACAQRMLHEHANLQQELLSEIDRPQGALRIAAVPTAMPVAARFAAMLQTRHPGIQPTVLSLSSVALEQGLEDLSLDLALGYSDRLRAGDGRLQLMPQYTEHYFMLRQVSGTPRRKSPGLRLGEPLHWREAAQMPQCLLTPDMHNRAIVDAAFHAAGVQPTVAMESNSVLTLLLSVQAGALCAVLPGALVDTVRSHSGLEALPLVDPDVRTPIAMISHALARPSRALSAALSLAGDPLWLAQASAHTGPLVQ